LRGEFLVLGLSRQALRPVQRQIEVAAAIVELTHFAARRFVVVEEQTVSLIERLGKNLGAGIAGDIAVLLERFGQRQKFAERIPAQVAFFDELLHMLGR